MEASDIPVIVCMPNRASDFTDNVVGPCDACGTEIMWRPHNPEPSTKLCLDCAGHAMEEQKRMGHEVEVMPMTKDTAREVAKGLKDWMKNRNQEEQ